MAHGSSNPTVTTEAVRPDSSTVVSVNASNTTVTILAANALRKSASFYNDSTSDAFLKLGATASTSDFTVKIPSNSFYELIVPCYTGVVDCIWTTATGSMKVTELT